MGNSLKWTLLGSCACIVAHGAYGQTASSEASSPAIEEITVTAFQRPETAQRTPATVSVLTAETLENAGVQRPSDYINLTPGVSIVSPGNLDVQVNIRGINGARDAENNFAYVVDGIIIANQQTFNEELPNVDQVEILKGPQSAIYGRDATAGAIVITTKKPTNDPENSISQTVANDSTFFTKADSMGPLVKDTLFYDLYADYRTTNGYFNNSFQGVKDVDNFSDYDVRGRLIWDASANTTVDFKVHYGEGQGGAFPYNAVFELPGFAAFTGNPAYYENINTHNYVYQGNIVPFDNTRTFDSSVKLDDQLDWAKFTGWLLVSDYDSSIGSDGTSAAFGFFDTQPTCIATTAALYKAGVKLPSPTAIGPTPETSFLGAYTPTACDGTQYQERNQRDISLDLRLTSSADEALRWIGGVYYANIQRHVGYNLGIDDGTGISPHLYNPAGTPNATEQLLDDDFSTNAYAVFGRVAYDILPDLEGALALRFDREERTDENLVPPNARTQYVNFTGAPYTGGAPLNPGLVPSINPAGVLPQSKLYQEPEPKVSLTWTPDKDLTVYANAGVGFKSGGFNSEGSFATINTYFNAAPVDAGIRIYDTYKKEVSKAAETGVKARFLGGHLQLEAAAYYTDVDNMQFFEFFVGSFGLLRVVSNIDQVEIWGGEAGLTYYLTDEITFNAGYNKTGSRIDANQARPYTVGNKSPYTPDYTGNLSAQWDHPFTDELSMIARLDWHIVGPTWFSSVQDNTVPTIFGAPANFSQTQRQEYDTLDLRAGFQFNGWSATVFGKNILDTHYAAEVIPAPEFGGAFVTPGDRTTVGITVSAKF